MFFVSVPVWIFREYMGAVFPSLLACLVGMFMGILAGAGEGGVQGMVVYCSTRGNHENLVWGNKESIDGSQ